MAYAVRSPYLTVTTYICSRACLKPDVVVDTTLSAVNRGGLTATTTLSAISRSVKHGSNSAEQFVHPVRFVDMASRAKFQ